MIARRSLDRRILALALPAVGSYMVLVIHRAVDMAWIRALGTDALASFTVSTVSTWMLHAVGALVVMGLTALVARYVGGIRASGARYVGAQGLRWAATLGLACGVAGWFCAPLFFTGAAAEPHVTDVGIAYTRLYWAGAVFVLLQLGCDAVFRGHGNTATPFKIAMVSLLANVGLDPLLIWGWGPIPAMGVPGAALATVLASLIGGGLGTVALLRHGHLQRARPPDEELRLDDATRLGMPKLLGLDGSIFRRMARIGTPQMTMSALFNLILIAMLAIAQRAGGPPAQAGLGIGWTGEGIAYVVCLGWAAASASLVGRFLGARQPQRAERAAWRAALQCASLNLVMGVVLFVFADEIAWAFAKGPDAQAYAASYFRIVALCLVPQAYEVVIGGAFGGAGMTVPPMIVGVTLAAARIPLAWFAAFELGMGVDGIWWTICITAALRGVLLGLWFAHGTWKTRTV